MRLASVMFWKKFPQAVFGGCLAQPEEEVNNVINQLYIFSAVYGSQR